MVEIKQKLVLKKKEKSKIDAKQRISLRALQQQKSLLRLEEGLIMATLVVGGVLGRTLMQGMPSVEPITFFAVLAGALFGWKKGMITGMSAWYLSNYLMIGGQGPWSVIHVLSGAFSGILGGLFLRKPNVIKAIFVMILATVLFEIPMNIMSGLTSYYGIIASFVTAVPFMITHLVSNIGFGLFLSPTKKGIWKIAKLEQNKLCKELIKKINVMKNEAKQNEQ